MPDTMVFVGRKRLAIFAHVARDPWGEVEFTATQRKGEKNATQSQSSIIQVSCDNPRRT